MNQSVIFIMITPENKILLEKKSAIHRNEPGRILLPGGQVEEGEMPEEAVRRELMEEFKIENIGFELIGHLEKTITSSNKEYETFFCLLKDWNGLYELDDFDELILVDFDEKAIELIDIESDREVLRKILKNKK